MLYYLHVEKRRFLSASKNPYFSESYKNEDKEKTGKSFDFSGLVDYTGEISNLLEDIEKLDRFAESVEDDLLNLMIDKAES